MKINIPTKITLARIALVVGLLVYFFVCQILGSLGEMPDLILGDTGIHLTYLIACAIFVVAAATDAVDGYLARKWHQVTDLGKFLDPIADKMLVNSLLIFLCVPSTFASGQMTIPVFCVILMVLRDLVVDTMRFVAASKGEVVAANIFGKLKTVFQMVAIPVCLLNGFPLSYLGGPALYDGAHILIYLATLMSLVSGVIYVVENRHVLKEKEAPHAEN